MVKSLLSRDKGFGFYIACNAYKTVCRAPSRSTRESGTEPSKHCHVTTRFRLCFQKIRTGHYVQVPTPRLSSLASLVSVDTAQTKYSKRKPKIQISKEEQHSFVRGE